MCIGGKIAPIFFNTMEDAGALPLEMDVTQMNMGDVIDVYPFEGVAKSHGTDEVLAEFAMKTNVIQDEVRAGGRIPLIIGRGLTAKARASLGMEPSDVFQVPGAPEAPPGYTLAQKMVGRACGVDGVAPGVYCEPLMTTVGSQDTTGPDDARRTQGFGVPRLLGRPGDAVLLPHGGLPQTRGRGHACDVTRLYSHQRWRFPPTGRRHHPLLAQPHALA